MPCHWQSVSCQSARRCEKEGEREIPETWRVFFEDAQQGFILWFYILDSEIVKVLPFTGNHSDCGETCTNIMTKVTCKLSKKLEHNHQ